MTDFGDKIFDNKEICNAIFSFSAEAILIVEEKGTIVHCNPTAESLFQYKREELLGQNINILLPPRVRKIHNSHLSNYNKSPHRRAMAEGVELYGCKKTGELFPLTVSLSPTVIGDKNITVALVIDISEQKEARQKLKEHNLELERKVEGRTRELANLVTTLEKTNNELLAVEEELRQALDAEKKLNELKSRFVSMASHEFRTPLSTILSSVNLIGKYPNQDQQDKRDKHIGRIRSNVGTLTSILNDFLSIDKLQEGKVECHASEFDLQELIVNVKEDLEQSLKPGQSIEIEGPEEVIVSLDPNMVRNIVNNLGSNAIKYSQENKRIKFVIIENNQTVTLKVIDQGIGIPEEDKDNMFERFFRAKNATNIQGTGLGLTIVNRYTQLMKGEITFESEYMEGSTFIVTLPKHI